VSDDRRTRWRAERRFGYVDYQPPIRVAGGLRARSQRGDIAKTWWSRRFLDALESYYGSEASRLARGRAYARAGQVIGIELSPGTVEASVQGSRPKPYAVRITDRELDDVQWTRAETAMAARAVFLARLLAGEMPDEIEEAFDAAKVGLFPARRGDLKTTCTCPDAANPCKHIAAVFYLLAESFDENPFLIFEWRGRPRERLVAELRALRPSSRAGSALGAETADRARRRALEAGASAGAADWRLLGGFWDGGPGWAEVPIEARPTGPPDALLREADDEVVRVLGDATMADLRRLYLRAAAVARRQLDPSRDEPTLASARTRKRRR
jgi:uncharacterized Zn finger protein